MSPNQPFFGMLSAICQPRLSTVRSETEIENFEQRQTVATDMTGRVCATAEVRLIRCGDAIA